MRIEGRLDFAGGWSTPPFALRLAPGVWTALLGPSGIGKSTILRLLAGLAAGGTLIGRIAADDGAPLAGRVALMGQADLLAPWLSVLDNVCLGARLRGARPDRAAATRLIADVGLAGYEDAKPRTLSGGQRQRVALARTLMEDRALVLLDEPFSALDARTRAEMQELAHATLAGRTVLIVTHEPGEAARLGQALYVFAEGGIDAVAPPPGPPIRDPADPAVLAAQAALLARLRGAAA
ncbi:MAG: ATP-binding cassette domain-containing protein [Pseudomonadota bacterium]